MKEDVGVVDTSEIESEKRGAGLISAIKDWRVWWVAIIMACNHLAVSFNCKPYAGRQESVADKKILAYFPTLVATMGFNHTVTLVLCAPPWIFTAILAYFWSQYASFYFANQTITSHVDI
jgi:hypothetical protein